MLKHKTITEILRFGVVGVSATAIHYGVYYALHFCLNANIAYATGYLVSFVFNYFMSARFTFKKSTTVRNGMGFILAHAFNFVLQMSLLNLFLFISVSKAMAPLPVYCIAVPVNFIIVRFVFRKA